MSAYISWNKVSSDETPFYLFTDSVNKSGGSCIIINDEYAQYVPNNIKHMNVKVFNLRPRVNETKFLVQHELRECKFRLNESACKEKLKWNRNVCQCRFKELDGWGSCEKCYMWSPCTCYCKFNKECKILNDEYLDTKNCCCKKCL